MTPLGSDVVVTASGVAVTVSSVLLVTPAKAAEMVVVPGETAVVKPPAVTVPTPVFDDLQVAWVVIFWVLLSE